jgi:anaerobic magnesium-protoporphyrin IX monomethyl ester cyclase
MNILLISTNREHAPQPVMPMGLCLVAAALEQHGFTPHVLDLCFTRDPQAAIAQAITKFTPDVIGLSIRNLDNGELLQTRAYLPEIEAYERICHQHSSAPLIIGGSAVSIAPQQLLTRLNADYAVAGDGEAAMVALATCLRDGAVPQQIAGVYGKADSTSTITPTRITDLAGTPDPQLAKWLEVRRYLRAGAHWPVQSKRGCAFHCIYCTYRLIEGNCYRLRAPAVVAEEISEARQHWGARHFEFVDATFNHPLDYALSLCEEIARRNLQVELHTTGINPAAASPELFALMHRAGFREIVCSPDSASDQMLQNLRRGFSRQDIEHTAVWAHQAGLSVLWAFLFGGPGENETTVQETLDFISNTLGPHDRVLCTVGLRVYANTELEQTALAKGAITSDTDLTDPVFYFSPQIAPARVLQMLDTSPRRAQMVYLSTLQNPLIKLALRLHNRLHLPGATWAAVPIYNRLASITHRSYANKKPKQ